MRVLMIAPTSFFSDYGGHIRIREEMRALGELGVEVAVVTYFMGNNVAGLDIRRTAPLPWHTDYEVGSSRHKIAFDVYLAGQSLREAIDFRPDIIHGHMHEGALIGGVIARMRRVPLVFDFQGSLTAEMVDHHFLNSKGPFFSLAYRLESIITRRFPAAILASSGQAIKLLREEFDVPAERIHSLPDCVDAQVFDPSQYPAASPDHPVRVAYGIPPSRTVIGYLGLLTDYQGIPHLIESALDMRQREEDVHFLVMGYPNVDHYQAIAGLRGVEDMITFTGRIPFDEAPYFLSACDIAVAPKISTSEGSGKLLNYMAMALPIVAYDSSVNREYLVEYGAYAQQGDVADFTRVLLELVHDPERRTQLGRQLRHRAIEEFSWRAAAQRIMKVYQIIDKRKATV